MFSVPFKIGNICFDKAILDLGASINVMPRSIYDKLNLGELKKTGMVIQLADRSNTYPDGVLEDVLVQVNELVFPADFYVMNLSEACHDIPILLGWPFLKTARTKIDVHEGALTMEFDGEILSSIFLMPCDFLLMLITYMHLMFLMNYLKMFMTCHMRMSYLLYLLRVLIILSFRKCHIKLMII